MDTTPLPTPIAMSLVDHQHKASQAKMADARGDNSDAGLPAQSAILTCSICNGRLRNPHLLPCLHVFCLSCLRDECQGKATDKFFCPACVPDDTLDEGPKSFPARAWHSFERVQEGETRNEELERRLSELPASENSHAEAWEENDDGDDSSDNDNDSESTKRNRRKSSVLGLEPPLLVPCTMHPDRLADTFCQKCEQLACHKCVSSFHRRCQSFNGLKEAVEAKRRLLDAAHDKMAANLVACEDVVDVQRRRLKEIEDMQTDTLVKIKKFRTDLVNMILAKEKTLTQEANQLFAGLREEASKKNEAAEKLAQSLRKQMELLDVSFSVKGEAELLPFLPGLGTRIENDSRTIGKQYSREISRISFVPDETCKSALEASVLGKIHVEGVEMADASNNSPEVNGLDQPGPDLDLSLVTSFHGGCREDVTEPLLTDLILLANGDVILTDRDNKCVKKFNQTGKLLTRVVLDAVPSRIATVSHARAVVSVMNKKALYFLSLFGTVRILNTVKVKKLYSFLTSLGQGLLAAGTNLCESIDVINEQGETIRSILTQKPEKASISRPLYLTPTVPRSTIILDNKNKKEPTVAKTNAVASTNAADDVSTRRGSGSGSVNANGEGAEVNGPPSVTVTVSKAAASTSKKATKKQIHSNNSKKPTSLSTSTTAPTSSSTPSTAAPSSSTLPSTSSAASSSSSSTSSSSSKMGHDILVSDSGKRVVFRLQLGGAVTFTLRSNDQLPLECPLGVAVHEKGLTLLVDRDKDSVLLLDNEGRFLKTVLSHREGIQKPCGIYAGMRGTVALSQVDGTVKIYRTV